MSHTTTLKNVALRDVVAMQQAVAELQGQGIDCELVEHAKPRMYYPDQGGNCEYVLKLNEGKYDVGFRRQGDGTFSPVLDTWGGHVGGQVGAVCPVPNSSEGRAQHSIGRFVQAYSKNAAINAAVQQGHTVESSSMDDEGNVHLTFAVQ